MSSALLALALPDLAVLRVRGDDRVAWLQGQVTNDVYAKGTLHAFRLDAQGRIEAEVRGITDDTSILLVVDARRADELASSLDRRIVMEDVEVARDRSLGVLAAYGDAARADLVDAPSIASRRFGLAGVEWIAPVDRIEPLRHSLLAEVGARATSLDELESIRIARGYPRFEVDFDAALPQETGLARSTVSFTKGCYVGQEPVVMLEHRGKPPRLMTVVEGPLTLRAPFDLARTDGSVIGHCRSYHEGKGLALLKRADARVDAELLAPGATVRVVRVVDEGPA